MPNGFSVILFVPGQGPEFDQALDWSVDFVKQSWPTIDGAVDCLLLNDGPGDDGKPHLRVAFERWRDRAAYEAYRQGLGQQTARRIVPFNQEIEYLEPFDAKGEAEGAGMHFLCRVACKEPEAQAIARAFRKFAEMQAEGDGFVGAQVLSREDSEAVFVLYSWFSDAAFLAWRKSRIGSAAAAWVRSFEPRVWKLQQRAYVRGPGPG